MCVVAILFLNTIRMGKRKLVCASNKHVFSVPELLKKMLNSLFASMQVIGEVQKSSVGI